MVAASRVSPVRIKCADRSPHQTSVYGVPNPLRQVGVEQSLDESLKSARQICDRGLQAFVYYGS